MNARVAVAVFVALGLALGSLVGTASADPITVGPAQIELDAAWVGGPVATDGSPILVRTNGDGVLTVTRALAGNTPAWRSATRDAYMTEVEKGLLAGADVVKVALTRKKLGKDNVNVIDVTLRRKGPKGTTEVVAVRVLLFRTLTIAAAAAAPDTRAGRKLVEAAVTGLSPR